MQYAEGPNTPVQVAMVRREVIVAAGPTKSPQLLQISGVGPNRLAKVLGVAPVADLPVGDNYQDHGALLLGYNRLFLLLPGHSDVGELWNLMMYRQLVNVTFDERMWSLKDNKTWYDEQYDLHLSQGKGYLTATSDNHMALLSARMLHGDKTDSLLSQYHDNPSRYLRAGVDKTTAGTFTRQHEILMASFATDNQAVDENSHLGTRTILVKPLSRGYIEAKTRNIWDPPAINPRTFSHPLDMENVLASIKYARRILATTEMIPLNPVETRPGLNVTSDDDLREFIRDNMNPGGAHGCCTVPMGPVLDSRMKVQGIEGLRVVDSSSWPMIPGAHSTLVRIVTPGFSSTTQYIPLLLFANHPLTLLHL
jgi:choline dehydrogenase